MKPPLREHTKSPKERTGPRTSPSRRPGVRDTDLTAFGAILDDLLKRVPGAFASALVDNEGETVDYAGLGEPFDVKVAAAHLRIVLNDVERYGILGAPRWMIVRGARRSFVARRLPAGYALVVLFRRRAGFCIATRAFAVCEHALAKEAGWKLNPAAETWRPIDVRVDVRGQPLRAGCPLVAVEVLEPVANLPRGERGYVVRTAGGRILTLVREARKAWYERV